MHFGHVVGADTDAGVRGFWRYTGGAPSAADCSTLALDFGGAWAAHLASLLDVSYSLTAVQVVDLSSSTGAEATDTTSRSGTRGGGSLTASVATLVNQNIVRRYRGGKSRAYWPFGVAGDISGPQTWGAAYVAAVQAGINAFVAECITFVAGTTSVASQANISFYSGFTVVTSPTTGRARNVAKIRAVPQTTDITSYGVNPKPAAQRRRMLR